jgi:hypothetical protein
MHLVLAGEVRHALNGHLLRRHRAGAVLWYVRHHQRVNDEVRGTVAAVGVQEHSQQALNRG